MLPLLESSGRAAGATLNVPPPRFRATSQVLFGTYDFNLRNTHVNTV
jgi:hypothetical protein